ncbi:DUF1648 domain-containing protein [Amycolatopsis sp. FDAARGOS 1241]|uniref:DUF1648 domain-containing protein n=1 Tax=Amycolatopsis sp. FDAARGOS 1241 TaxID=2778070 RepID=UPI0019503F5B|nr:DUF5808 domain-containing protein [Amycolatopsis sp. FDAARGOS 1241]QRP44360.1 DUF1648 domain-containing protein [Amycolatopsis sp. FDAARGOS 1241]
MIVAVVLRDVLAPALLLAAAWVMPSVVKPTVPFGVRVPEARVHDPLIVEQRRIYRWWVGAAGAAVVLAGLVVSVLVQQVLVPALVVVALLGVVAPGYVRARAVIRSAKQREDWYRGLRQTVSADTSRAVGPPFPWLWALPALTVLVATVVLGVVRYPDLPATLALHYDAAGVPDRTAAKSVGSAFTLVFVQAGITALFLGIAAVTPRFRPDLNPARPRSSAEQHRRFASSMTRVLLMFAACVNVSMLVASLQVWSGASAVSLVAIVGPVVLGAAGLLVFAVRAGQGGNRLATPGTEDEPRRDAVERDDDRFWKGGLLYVNRADRAVFVPKRFGIGWTLNFGNPVALGAFALLLAVVIAVPFVVR